MNSKLDLIKARVASLEILKNPAGGGAPERLGITPGGFHHEEDGTAWYVKHHNNPDHAHAEHLANKVYRALGHNAPHSMILYHHAPTGKLGNHGLPETEKRPVYLSKKIEGFKTLMEHREAADFNTDGFSKESAQHFLHGTAADTLLGNDDMHAKNVGLIHGKAPARIDNGATLNYRGAGWTRTEEGTLHGTKPHEIVTGNTSHRHAMSAAGISPHHVISAKAMAPHVKKILQLRQRHGGWQGFVDRHIPGADPYVRKNFAHILETRTRNLVDHVVKDHAEEIAART